MWQMHAIFERKVDRHHRNCSRSRHHQSHSCRCLSRHRHSYSQCCEAECNYKNRRQMPIKLRWQKPEQQQTNPKDAMTKIARQKLMRGNVRPPAFHLCRRLYAIKMKRPQTKWYKLLWVVFSSSSHLIFGIKDRPLNYDRRAGEWTDGNVDGQENRERLKFD